jgi:hypothetical protein
MLFTAGINIPAYPIPSLWDYPDAKFYRKHAVVMKRRKALKGLAVALSGLVTIPGCRLIPATAMCYDPAVEYYVDYVCPYCNSIIKGRYGDSLVYFIGQIDEIVKQMKELEYDVVLDKTEFCPYCSKKDIQNPELILKIRFSDEVEYHIARSNIVYEYQCLFEFLSNPNEFSGNKAIIQKMTGLGEDLKIKKITWKEEKQ